MMSAKARIILSVSNDLNSDQRLQKVCKSLVDKGHDLVLLGRFLKGRSKPLDRPYSTKRFKLWFNKGPLFYVNLNIRLFFYLLFAKYDLLIANDLDTLPANYLAAKLRNKSLVYDSHEYFTEVPELIGRPRKKAIWERIEKSILPKLKYAYTVSPSIALAYRNKYGLEMGLVRNFPLKQEHPSSVKKQKVVIYQGALNVGRGLEELIRAFSSSSLEGVELWIFGVGDIEKDLMKLAKSLHLNEQITFFGRKEAEELRRYTERAALGVSLEHAMGLSYQYAIPNKLFDYLQAGAAVLYAPLKEVEYLLDDKEVGEKLRSHEPEKIAEQIREMLDSDQLQQWQDNAKALSKDYCWENEEKVLLKIVDKALND
jgi:glycosyltransferase involved in cell wall biosynthesis